MALDPDTVEDGTGLLMAEVYEQPETAADWLAVRGKTALLDAEEEDRNAAYLVATEAAEQAVRPYLEDRSVTVTEGQGLLFPRLGAYTSSGELLNQDEIPAGTGRLSGYIKGIRLIADLVVRKKFMPRAGGPAGVEEERSRHGGIKYRSGIDLSTLSTNHQEEWRLISCAVPRL